MAPAPSDRVARYRSRPPWRTTSRLTVDGARPRRAAIVRKDAPDAMPLEMSSRSVSVSAEHQHLHDARLELFFAAGHDERTQRRAHRSRANGEIRFARE